MATLGEVVEKFAKADGKTLEDVHDADMNEEETLLTIIYKDGNITEIELTEDIMPKDGMLLKDIVEQMIKPYGKKLEDVQNVTQNAGGFTVHFTDNTRMEIEIDLPETKKH